jgi:hypothetical protein
VEKTERVLRDEEGFVCNLISLIQNSTWKLLCPLSGNCCQSWSFIHPKRHKLSFKRDCSVL